MKRFVIALAAVLVLLIPLTAQAASQSPGQIGESIRAALVQAQLDLADNPGSALQDFETAHAAYSGGFAKMIATAAPDADARVQDGFARMQTALSAQDTLAVADARAQVWTAILDGSYAVVEKAIAANDTVTAESWLPLREFRRTNRFSRPGVDATNALEDFVQGKLSATDANAAIRAELFDTYQARLTVALSDALVAEKNQYGARRAESTSLAAGYFAILAPSFLAQHGQAQTRQTLQAFAALRDTAVKNQSVAAEINTLNDTLNNFRAAPLTAQEQARRAGQFQRFLNLVPVEYGRGVSAGIVTSDLELQEASTFRDGAAAAFADVRTILDARDPAKTAQIAALLDQLQSNVNDTSSRTRVTSSSDIQATTDQIKTLMAAISPAEWSQRDSQGDFDVVATLLDQMQQAAAQGQYDLAESTRLEAYAVMESGPEARLVAAAPQLKTPIEDLFWNGQGEHPGLAYLLRQHASIATIKDSRAALDVQLSSAQQELASSSAPLAVATNAGIIVFREGLEAVLILAALLGSLKMGEMRKYRKGMWIGVAVAFLVTILTWILAGSLLSRLAGYGDSLEAVVSLIAVGVLLLILNWFFHKVYWTGWIGSFQSRKRAVLGQTAGQMLGLALLGFTSVYREGFEVVLFLQALVLEAGAATVLLGVAVALAAVILIGVATFVLQTKLPYKKMLVATGIMIGAVLLIMVGNTIHVMQVIGWMSITPIRDLDVPYWMGTWFGIYPTVETLGFQALAAAYVFGSYYLAERQAHHGSGKQAPASAVSDEREAIPTQSNKPALMKK